MSFTTEISFIDRAGGKRRSARHCALARSLARQWGGQWTVSHLVSVDQNGDAYNHGWRGYLTVLCYDNRLPPVTRTVGLRKLSGARAQIARHRVKRRARLLDSKQSRPRSSRRRSTTYKLRALAVPAGAVAGWIVLPDLLRVLAIITAAGAAAVAVRQRRARRVDSDRVVSQASVVHRPAMTGRPIVRRPQIAWLPEREPLPQPQIGYDAIEQPVVEPVRIPPPEPVPGLPVAAPAVRQRVTESDTETITP
jgi:hypothetical protein